MAEEMLAVLAAHRRQELLRQAERDRLIRASRAPRPEHRNVPRLIAAVRVPIVSTWRGARWTIAAAGATVRELAAMETTRSGPHLHEYPLARRTEEPASEACAS